MWPWIYRFAVFGLSFPTCKMVPALRHKRLSWANPLLPAVLRSRALSLALPAAERWSAASRMEQSAALSPKKDGMRLLGSSLHSSPTEGVMQPHSSRTPVTSQCGRETGSACSLRWRGCHTPRKSCSWLSCSFTSVPGARCVRHTIPVNLDLQHWLWVTGRKGPPDLKLSAAWLISNFRTQATPFKWKPERDSLAMEESHPFLITHTGNTMTQASLRWSKDQGLSRHSSGGWLYDSG